MKWPTLVTFIIVIASPHLTRADEVIFSYEGNVLPYDPSGGFALFDPCKDCSDFVQDGHYIVEWGEFGDQLNLDRDISSPPDPPFPTLWAEWRFRSNVPLTPGDVGCDGRASMQYRGIVDSVDLHGTGAVSFEGSDFLVGLPVNEFRTLRFQSYDGENYTYAIDGVVFNEDFDAQQGTGLYSSIQFGGDGSCDRPSPGFISRNEWDFVRYGTIGEGEAVVASDPPSGLVDAEQYPFLYYFTVTFDQPAFVYINDITVSVSGPGSPPGVVWVKRPENAGPNTVEIVLDDALPLNATTTFTFDTGGTPNTVTYTYAYPRACCLPKDGCENIDGNSCAALGGEFNPAAVCEGDADGDGFDALCGDQCPMDSSKLTPGQCGCGQADIDSDLDTVADCVDQCDGRDDTIDTDDNGIPDCVEFTPIPTASTWGLAILALLLLIAAKVRFSRRSLVRESLLAPSSPHPYPLPRGEGDKLLILVPVLLVLFTVSSAQAATHYAKVGGSGNCSTWANACSLATALSSATSGDEVWVKAGTHSPFALKNGVKIIGGFAGTETLASQSNPTTNATIVDGGGTSQCVTGNGEGPSTILRGFTIKNGYLSGFDLMGAGIYLEESSAKIVNCIIENNQAEFFGAGAAIKGTGAPEFINCTFRNNGTGTGTSAKPYGGGAVWIDSGSPKFTNCLFHDNIAGDAAGLSITTGTATLINCTVAYNSAQFGSGGGIFDQEAKFTIQNSIIWGNTAARDGAQVFYFGGNYGTPNITYSDVQGGFTGTGNINSDPLFVNVASDDYKIPGTSPCRNAGSNSLLPADIADLDWDTNTTEQIPKDLGGLGRKFGLIVDMGAHEAVYIEE